MLVLFRLFPGLPRRLFLDPLLSFLLISCFLCALDLRLTWELDRTSRTHNGVLSEGYYIHVEGSRAAADLVQDPEPS